MNVSSFACCQGGIPFLSGTVGQQRGKVVWRGAALTIVGQVFGMLGDMYRGIYDEQ